VVRTNSETVYLGGIFVLDRARAGDTGSSFDAEQTLTVGTTAGIVPPWTDVPIAVVRQTEHKEGEAQYVFHPDSQRDEISLGIDVAGTFVPLIGTRADATHAPPPQAQNRLVSLGVYDPTGAYHPVAGGRAHFEELPADLWLLRWVESGGPGSQAVGNWEADLGVFDPGGSLVPLAGVTYADRFEGAANDSQMILTAGPWLAESYQPLLGVTYDGDAPLLLGPQRYLVSAGSFSPLDGGYVPVAGASYARSSDETYAAIEDYRVGVFAGSYSSFVPLVAARWSGERFASTDWASRWSGSGGPGSQSAGDFRLDVGGAGPDAGFLPLAGVSHDDSFSEGREPNQMLVTAGPWVGGSYLPAVGVTYDGDGALAAGAERWLASAGFFSPLDGSYLPLAGASFDVGRDAEGGVRESYRAGVFPADYGAFVPLAGADWSSDRRSDS
ncbi:MAG: hypothetical protein ACREQY_22400, partial [Candidatus Binatia bacterium]